MNMRDLINLFEDINEIWFKDSSFETYKHPTPIKYETATQSGTINTLEGPVAYKAGYKIITGAKGERYPIPPEKFAGLYDTNSESSATPKKITKLAKLADHDGAVKTSWGETLHYKAGEDYIVRHGANDYGVVKKDIFAKTYAQPAQESQVSEKWSEKYKRSINCAHPRGFSQKAHCAGRKK